MDKTIADRNVVMLLGYTHMDGMPCDDTHCLHCYRTRSYAQAAREMLADPTSWWDRDLMVAWANRAEDLYEQYRGGAAPPA
jgi:hypothetical protein